MLKALEQLFNACAAQGAAQDTPLGNWMLPDSPERRKPLACAYAPARHKHHNHKPKHNTSSIKPGLFAGLVLDTASNPACACVSQQISRDVPALTQAPTCK
jgi:hypothetical protein